MQPNHQQTTIAPGWQLPLQLRPVLPCHSPIEAANIARRTFEKPPDQWTDEQKQALHRYKSDEQDIMSLLKAGFPGRLGGPPGSCLDLFDKIFFDNELQHSDFKLVHSTEIGGARGRTGGRDRPFIRIAHNLEPTKYNVCRSHWFMRTLLHEGVHACLKRLSCKGYCGKDICKQKFAAEMGCGGHGPAWHLLASAVERVTREYVVGFRLSLGGWDALEAYKKQDGKGLTDDVFEKCFPERMNVDWMNEDWMNEN